MKRFRKYLALFLSLLLSLGCLPGASAQEIGDQLTFAYYVDGGELRQIGVQRAQVIPASKVIVQTDQATAYYWVAPDEGTLNGSLYLCSLLSGSDAPTLISDQVYGEPVYVRKDSRIYFLDARDSRLLRAVTVAPYQLQTAVEEAATLPFAQTCLSDSLEGLHVQREIAAGLYVNRVYQAEGGALVSSTLDPQSEYRLFDGFETQQRQETGLQLRVEASESWRQLTGQTASCQAAWEGSLYYALFDEATGCSLLYHYEADSMQTTLLAQVPAQAEQMAAYGEAVALLSADGALYLVNRSTGEVSLHGEYSAAADNASAFSAFDLQLAGTCALVYGLRAEDGLPCVLEVVQLSAANTLPTPTVTPTATPAPTPSPSPTPIPTLQSGSRGDAVRQLQQRLRELGYPCGQADGIYGEQTRMAVLYFQDQAGLLQDGSAGASVQKRLYASDAPAYVQYITKSRGDTGIRVQELQERLRELGYLADAADGEYGRRTQEAVELFQQECGLRATGKATVATLKELFASDAPLCSSYIPLQRGDSGRRVTELNKRLKELGYLSRGSSRYSQDTEEAVRQFQSLSGLTVSGAADRSTLKALFAADAVAAPTPQPTEAPTQTPVPTQTPAPTAEPTAEPTVEPTPEPTAEPTLEPTLEPTAEPTLEPTAEPTVEPTAEPTEEPTPEPTVEPTLEPTQWAVTREQVAVLVELLNAQYPADPPTYTEDSAVAWLQTQLIALGYLPEDFPVGSPYDQSTRDAVQALQQAEIPDSDTLYTEETWGVVDQITFTQLVDMLSLHAPAASDDGETPS